MQIEIISPPSLSCEPWLNQAWVGCIMKPVNKEPEMQETSCCGGTGAKFMGYSVDYDAALAALEKNTPVAAARMELAASILLGTVKPDCLCFRQEVCRIIL